MGTLVIVNLVRGEPVGCLFADILLKSHRMLKMDTFRLIMWPGILYLFLSVPFSPESFPRLSKGIAIESKLCFMIDICYLVHSKIIKFLGLKRYKMRKQNSKMKKN